MNGTQNYVEHSHQHGGDVRRPEPRRHAAVAGERAKRNLDRPCRLERRRQRRLLFHRADHAHQRQQPLGRVELAKPRFVRRVDGDCRDEPGHLDPAEHLGRSRHREEQRRQRHHAILSSDRDHRPEPAAWQHRIVGLVQRNEPARWVRRVIYQLCFGHHGLGREYVRQLLDDRHVQHEPQRRDLFPARTRTSMPR